jgi:uncharacterized protein YaiI (UPF0178 family)
MKFIPCLYNIEMPYVILLLKLNLFTYRVRNNLTVVHDPGKCYTKKMISNAQHVVQSQKLTSMRKQAKINNGQSQQASYQSSSPSVTSKHTHRKVQKKAKPQKNQ